MDDGEGGKEEDRSCLVSCSWLSPTLWVSYWSRLVIVKPWIGRLVSGVRSPMSDLRIGVIVPTYNRGAIVLDALESIAAQTRPPDRVVVVDDGSTDDTAERVTAWIGSNTRPFQIDLVRQPNAGVSAARNRAAQELNDCGAFAFLDSDDLWPPDYLARTVGALLGHPECVAVCTSRKIVNVVTGEEQVQDFTECNGRVSSRFIAGYIPTASITVVRASEYHSAGGYDANLRRQNDWDFHMRLSLCGPWRFVPGSPVTMRRGVTEQFGCAAHLTDGRGTTDLHVFIAYIIDRFVFEHGGAAAIPASVWRVELSRRWCRLGRRFSRERRVGEAAWCYEHAIRINPWMVKAWLNRLITPAWAASPLPQSVSAAARPI